jgi:ribosomal protein L21E
MANKFNEGDRVRVATRPVTEEDRKKNRYFEHMAGLTGVVQNVYDGGVVALRVDEATLSTVTADVHARSVERMRDKFFSQIGEEAKKSLTKDELEFGAHFMHLVDPNDLEKLN